MKQKEAKPVVKSNQQFIPSSAWEDLKKDMPGLEQATRETLRSVSLFRFSLSTVTIIGEARHLTEALGTLQENGLRLMTYREALYAITTDPELKDKLKGQAFWVLGEQMEKSGICLVKDYGEIGAGRSKDPENNIFVFPGKGPFLLRINSDDVTPAKNMRFVIFPDTERTAPIVVGVSQEIPYE